MKTLVFLAKGFETIEFSVFIDVMGWAGNDYGYDTQITACGFQKCVISAFNVPVWYMGRYILLLIGIIKEAVTARLLFGLFVI